MQNFVTIKSVHFNYMKKYAITHAKEKSKFEAGLRGFFEYRDLGINAATEEIMEQM